MSYSYFRDGIVPVVMGPPRRDYERKVPPNSFIHVDDFKSPKSLAAYLSLVGNSEELYSKYLEWKHHYMMLNPSWPCRVCALLHSKPPPSWYDNLDFWYRHPDVCVDPSPTNPYASWKIDEKRYGIRSVDFSKNGYTILK